MSGSNSTPASSTASATSPPIPLTTAPGQTDIQTLQAAFSAHPALAYAVHQAAEKFPAFFAQNPMGATASVAAAAGIHNPFASAFLAGGGGNSVAGNESARQEELASTTVEIAGGVGTPSNLGGDSVMLDLATPGSLGRPGSSGGPGGGVAREMLGGGECGDLGEGGTPQGGSWW